MDQNGRTSIGEVDDLGDDAGIARIAAEMKRKYLSARIYQTHESLDRVHDLSLSLSLRSLWTINEGRQAGSTQRYTCR